MTENQTTSKQEQANAEIQERIARDAALPERARRIRRSLWIGGGIVAAAAVVGLSFALGNVVATPPGIEPKFPGEGAVEGTVTISAPIRNEGASNVIYSDSILITLSKSLADEGWMPLLSDGSCNALSPGANTSFTGADGVQVTSFDQTTATHIVLTQSEDDIDCDLEYAVPSLEGAAGTFTTTVTPGE